MYENYKIGDYVIIDTKVDHKLFPPYVAEIIDIYYLDYNNVSIKMTKLKNNDGKINHICNDEIIFPIKEYNVNIQMKLF